MVDELSDLVDKEPMNIKEKAGCGLVFLSALPVIPYMYNRLIAQPSGKEEIFSSVAEHAGNVPQIMMLYLGGKLVGRIFNNPKVANACVALATAYHTVGEIFGSEIAPNLPQIMPGTPDLKDIPLTLAMGIGLYLANKKAL